MNIESLKNLVTQIFTHGNTAVDKMAYPQPHQVDPVQQQGIQSRFQSYATSTPSKFISDVATKLRNEYTPDTTGSRIAFQQPFQNEMRQTQTPEYQSVAQRMGSLMSQGTDWAKRIGNSALDWTLRPIITRPVAQATMSVADALTPGAFPTFTPNDPAGKLLFGKEPLNSYQQQGRNATSWLEDLGVGKNTAVPLGYVAGGLSAGLDLPLAGGLLKTGAKEVGEQAIKTTAKDAGEAILKTMGTKDRLSFLMNYGKQLLANGFTREQVDKIGVKEAATILKNDIKPQQFANTQAIEQPVNDALKSGISAFKEWVGSRSASKWEGIVQSKKFQELDQMGQEGIKQIESGDYRKEFQFVRDYFDQARQKLVDAGVSIGKVQDYLPHMWQQTDKEAEILLGRKLSQSTPFSLQRLIKTYSDGIDVGLTPKYNTVSDLVGAYESSINKVIADRKFFSYLKGSNLIKTSEKAGRDWVTLNPDRFPIMSGDSSQVYKASPQLGSIINNYLDNPTNLTAKLAGLSTDLKNIILSSGVPHTGINSMGAMTLVRNTLASDNPVKGFLKATGYIVNPSLAEKALNNSIEQIPDAVKHGLTVSNEDYKFIQPYLDEAVGGLKGGVNKLMNIHANLFEKDTFEKILPALKIQNYQSNVAHLLKSMPETEAKQTAAQITNNFFGGMNLDQLLRNKENQNWFRILSLAPDLYESQGRVGAGVVASLFKPGSPALSAYRTYARNLVMFRLSTELLNKATSGHFQSENRTGNKFNIETSYYDSNGKQLVIKNPGIDWLKVPVDLIDSMVHGDTNSFFRVLRNRASVLASAVGSQVGNQKWNGQPITTKEMTPGEQLVARGTEGLASITPSYLSTGLRATQGNQSLPETLSSLTELPAYWQGGAYSKTDLNKVKIMKSGGASGKDINSVLNPENTTLTSDKPAWSSSEKGSNNTGKLSTLGSLKNYTSENNKSKEKNKTIQTIFDTLNSDQEISQALEKNGISYKEGVSYMISQLGVENGQRGEMIMSVLKDTTSKQEFSTTAYNLAKEGLLTTAVTAKWLSNGDINASQKKQYDNLIKGAKGMKISTGGSAKALPANTKMTAPKYSMPAIKAVPKLNSLSAVSKPFQTRKIKEIAKLPSMAELKNVQLNVKPSYNSVPQAPGR